MASDELGAIKVDVSNILQDIYDSEINITISWFWDSGINAIIGDTTNGVRKAQGFDTIMDALAWLRVTIPELYPESEFAKVHQSEDVLQDYDSGPCCENPKLGEGWTDLCENCGNFYSSGEF